MKRLTGYGLIAATAAVLESGLSLAAQAQVQVPSDPRTPAASTAPGGGAGSIVAVAIIAALIVGIVVMVKVFDARRRREDRLAGVQGRLSDTLAADPLLARLPLTVSVDAPKWTTGPAVVTLSGVVASEELRAAARAIVQTEARTRLDSFELDDRMLVDPVAWRRAA